MSSLKEQIAELEAENVAPKEWTLMGEAGSRSRPQNSLLEEDLEFERVMKAVPVTTEESVKSLEETIKARILENRFDDVVRIRPLEDKPFLPSKFFELNDKKSSQSLAQIYENDYVANQAGGSLPDDRDGKLAKEHEEINALWENICGKLDALCNAHFVPKQVRVLVTECVFVILTHLILAEGHDIYCCEYGYSNPGICLAHHEVNINNAGPRRNIFSVWPITSTQ